MGTALQQVKPLMGMLASCIPVPGSIQATGLPGQLSGKQQMMECVFGRLPPMWETQTEFKTPNFDLAQPWKFDIWEN